MAADSGGRDFKFSRNTSLAETPLLFLPTIYLVRALKGRRSRGYATNQREARDSARWQTHPPAGLEGQVWAFCGLSPPRLSPALHPQI